MKRGYLELNKFFISLIIFGILFSLFSILPVVSAGHCSAFKDLNGCDTSGGYNYCSGNNLIAHRCKWMTSGPGGTCMNVDIIIKSCRPSGEQYCSSDRSKICTSSGCVEPPGEDASCKEDCTSCPSGQICVDKAPFGPGCVKYPQTADTTDSSFYNLANIKNNLKIFLFPLLALFIIIILAIFLLKKKKKSRRK